MTVTHLVFALVTTAYILIAIRLEERDLVAAHREYDEYRRRVPMLFPRLFGNKEAEGQKGREAGRIFSKERIEEVVGVVFIAASFFLTGWFYYNLYQALQSYQVF